MKNAKLFALLLSALLLAAPLTACGTNNDPASAGSPDVAASQDKTESKDESSGKDSAASSDSKESKDSKSSADSKNGKDSKDSKADSKAEASKDSKDTSADSGDASSSDDKGSSDSKAENKNNNTGGQQNQGGNNNAGGTSAPDDDDPDEDDGDEEKPMKYIQLHGTSAKYSGEGISVSGSKITISKGGHYEISGELENGQIYIETDKKKVKLFLNNCSITNKAGSAINCQAAKKVTLESMPGTVNSIQDGGTHDADHGAIYSEDTVVLKGEGELNITGVYAHGIHSDDDIQVKGGNINITAAKSCLHSNDAIEIYGGTMFCNGGTNGMKTRGFINIMGGSSVFIGGVREEKGAIACGDALTVTGGTFWAIGNTCSMPDASTTTANVVGIVFSNAQAGESAVNVKSGGNTLFTMSSPNSYKYVLYSGPNLLPNGEYQVSYGGTGSGGDHYIYSDYSGGTDGGTFTAGNTVTVHTVS